MATSAVSRTTRLLRLHHSSDCGIMLCEFQKLAGLRINHRRTKTNIDTEIADDGLPKDYRLQVFKLSSRRLDSIVCKATGKGRGQAEKMILTGKVQVNEEDMPKKAAYYVQENDIIDIWKQPVEGNTKFAEVHRIEIINYMLTEQGYDINLKSWKNFYVQNWRDRK